MTELPFERMVGIETTVEPFASIPAAPLFHFGQRVRYTYQDGNVVEVPVTGMEYDKDKPRPFWDGRGVWYYLVNRYWRAEHQLEALENDDAD